ncbi:MAG: adenosine deaminase, partial [Gammaproteobacteria bacterium]
EMLLTPDHAAMCGVSYQEYLAGVAQGIDDARHDFSIESRAQIMCVRNFGIESCVRVAKQAALYPHPYVVGFTMGGDEVHFPARDYIEAYLIARDAGLGCSIHAGEMAGAESVRDAIMHLPIQRIGHGVRAVEDKSLLNTIVERGITLEVCPSSNIALAVYPDYQHHPFKELYDYGIAVTLNTDDPPYFETSLNNEYEI